MDFPAIKPSGRQFDPGDWPVRRFEFMDGAEVRILYGSKRTGATLDLEWQNLPDEKAASFVQHFNSVVGTFSTFTVPDSHPLFAGWKSDPKTMNAPITSRWRWETGPKLRSVKPGRSTVTGTLKAVL